MHPATPHHGFASWWGWEVVSRVDVRVNSRPIHNN
ncbi:hypothetical protein FOXYSP1_20262 [Fusarium oxysporum f. sp. phaseoli]